MDILSVVDSHAEHFATHVVDFANWAPLYGWIGAISALAAILTFAFVVFRREAGAISVTAIVQYAVVYALPYIWQAFAAMGTGTTPA